MSDEMPPALTTEQWARSSVEHGPYTVTLRDGQLALHGVSTSVHVPAALRPALAALALHDTAAAPSHEWIRALEIAAQRVADTRRDGLGEERNLAALVQLGAIADWLRSLLPPE